MKSYLIECAEINYFTIEVDAESMDEAAEKARANVNSYDVIDEYVSEWDINEIRELDEGGCAIWQTGTQPLHTVQFISIIREYTNKALMRKIEQQMNNAVNNRVSWSNSNTRVDRMGNRSEVYLHNNHIATVYDDGDLQLSSAGWETVTTKSR